jgi:uncharacterized protein (TIGR02246 family)
VVNTRQKADDKIGAKKMRVAFLIPVLALVFVSPVRTADASKDEAAVRDIIAQFDKAWNNHDGKALAELYAETSSTVNRHGVYYPLGGRAEQEQQYTKHHGAKGPFKDSRSAPQKIFELRFIRPDLALVRTMRTIWETPEMTREDMIVSYLMTKNAGKWSITSADLHNVGGAAAGCETTPWPVPLPQAPHQ